MSTGRVGPRLDRDTPIIATADLLRRLERLERRPTGGAPAIRCGYQTVTTPANTPFAIAHTLGETPSYVNGVPLGWMGTIVAMGGADATTLYLMADQALTDSYIYWLAIGPTG